LITTTFYVLGFILERGREVERKRERERDRKRKKILGMESQ
jgi:hypothetical protein